MTIEELEQALARCGCPERKLEEMAVQLDKRARQLVEQRGQPYEQAVGHLMGLMRQGWAAQQGGHS